jgi:hypothetical protein
MWTQFAAMADSNKDRRVDRGEWICLRDETHSTGADAGRRVEVR